MLDKTPTRRSMLSAAGLTAVLAATSHASAAPRRKKAKKKQAAATYAILATLSTTEGWSSTSPPRMDFRYDFQCYNLRTNPVGYESSSATIAVPLKDLAAFRNLVKKRAIREFGISAKDAKRIQWAFVG